MFSFKPMNQKSEDKDYLAKLDHYVTLPSETSLIKMRLQKLSITFYLKSKLKNTRNP